jgi:predicted phage-related endonuclease
MGAVAIKDEATWLSLRDSYVGGSEIASLFYQWQYADGSVAVHHLYETPEDASARLIGCLSNFRSGYRLWMEKAGRLPPEDLSEVDRVRAGQFLEPAIAEWARSKWADWGGSIRKVRRYMTHPTVDGWGASLDYEIVATGMPPVEIKTADAHYVRDAWTVDGDEIVMPPLPYVLQLQHQMGAVDAPHGWIVALVGGNQLMRGKIARHEPTQQRIADAISAFWRGVREGVEPTWLAEYETTAKVYAYGDKAAAADLTADAEMPALCERYLERKAALVELETEVEGIKGQIASRLGEATKATTAGYRLSWPVMTREEKIIPERIQKALTYRGGLTIKREA